MQKLFILGLALLIAGSASAAPNVTNVTQKGSLLIWPDIRVDGGWNTIVRIQNDGTLNVDVICYWMDGNKNRVDFIITLTKNQPVWFEAKGGSGSTSLNRFPTGLSNGFDNPDLISPGFTTEAGDLNAPYRRGLLACWAVDGSAENQVKWNHLSGTATVFNTGVPASLYETTGAYEYNAYAFFVPTGLDQESVGVPGALNLNGVEYDSCPLYQIGQFSPTNRTIGGANNGAPEAPFPQLDGLEIMANRLAIAGCSLNLNQDFVPVRTKLQFDVWNSDEVKFTGAFECADSWHETVFADAASFPTTAAITYALAGGPIDSAAANFTFTTLGTDAARYRVQGVKSTQCPNSIAVGLIAVQSSNVNLLNGIQQVVGSDWSGTTLAAAGKFTGKIVWDPAGVVPEGGIR
jgi:hypothetical protein